MARRIWFRMLSSTAVLSFVALVEFAVTPGAAKGRNGLHDGLGARPRGVSESKAHLYQQAGEGASGTTTTGNATFQCLDGSGVIPFSSVNDDYCDCPDGSDEPGTSACPNGFFHCTNAGHLPALIRSNRVNDGICDVECCDGSDEFSSGVRCPNRCQELGAAHRAATSAQNAVQAAGYKKKLKYIKDGMIYRAYLRKQVETLQNVVKGYELDLEQSKSTLERLESEEKESVERKRKSNVFIHLEHTRSVVQDLQKSRKDLQDKLENLIRMLRDLETGYNPNSQDMAVKGVALAFKEWRTSNKKYVTSFEFSDEEEETEGDEVKKESDVDEPEETEDLDQLVDDLAKVDHLNLLDDIGMSSAAKAAPAASTTSRLLHIEHYLPDQWQEGYQRLRRRLLEILIKFGVVDKIVLEPASASSEAMDFVSTELAAARKAVTSAENDLREHAQKLNEARLELEQDYGSQWEWSKLKDVCIEKNSGEYTYTLCLFGRATQKSNRDHASNHLGSFSTWHPGFPDPSSKEHYSMQVYANGARCWNGPDRSVKASLSCGEEHTITSIMEPEKCEYLFKVTSPVACTRPGDSTVAEGLEKEQALGLDAVKDEL